MSVFHYVSQFFEVFQVLPMVLQKSTHLKQAIFHLKRLYKYPPEFIHIIIQHIKKTYNLYIENVFLLLKIYNFVISNENRVNQTVLTVLIVVTMK